jgi:hypothetical protein
MARWKCAILMGCLVGWTAAPAHAGPFGLGMIIGEPTGLSAKLGIGRENAVDGALAWSLDDDDDVQVHADYLFHNYTLLRVEEGKLPLYFGIGGRLRLLEDRDDRVGIRFPVGLEYIFASAPFEVFVEIAGILDLTPDTDFEVNGGLGVRYTF